MEDMFPRPLQKGYATLMLYNVEGTDVKLHPHTTSKGNLSIEGY